MCAAEAFISTAHSVTTATTETWIRAERDKYEVIGNLARYCKRGALSEGPMIKLWWDQRPLSSLWSIGQSLKHAGYFCDKLVIKIYLRVSRPRSVEGESSEAEQEATLVLNCCMCASFSFTCCDTSPPGAICSCCFISHSNQRGHKDPANKGSRNRLLKQSCHVRQRPPSRLFLFFFFFLATCWDKRFKRDSSFGEIGLSAFW